ncbi:hypothetical protein CC2G_002352 [Coprinopsis cinerea AmutBmut pab1-1]|nr:hypothetical protein CC2G_002352 [Coprinopsis cinerea AmutBmut pab1-1]
MTPFKDVFRRLLGVQLGIIRDVWHNFSEREDSPDEDHRGEDNSPLFVVLEQVADMHEAIRDAYDDDYNIGEIWSMRNLGYKVIDAVPVAPKHPVGQNRWLIGNS